MFQLVTEDCLSQRTVEMVYKIKFTATEVQRVICALVMKVRGTAFTLRLNRFEDYIQK